MSDTKIKSSNIAGLAVTHDKLHTTMDLTGKTVTVATPSAATHPATKAYVDGEVAGLIDSAPGTLNTLNELAAAVNDDANFNATIATSIATKLPLAGGTMTGAIDMGANNITTTGKVLFGNVYATEGDLPSGSTYHGMFAHVHATGKGYYSHAGAWVQLANAGASGGGYEDADTAAYLATSQNKTINTSSGNVGIGTASPSASLDVVTNTNVYAAEFTQSNTSNGDGVSIVVGSTAAADYALTVRSNAGNTSVLAAKADGKVGIGVFSPTSPLHIEGADFSSGTAYIKQTVATNTPTLFIEQVGQGGNGGDNQGLLIKVDGTNSGAGNMIRAIGTNSNQNGGADIDVFTVQNSGKVGIGTATPGARLHVFKAGSANDGMVSLIKVQTDTNNTTGDGSGIEFHGKYLGGEWGFGKIGGTNSGANYGGALEFHTNSGNGSSVSTAFTKKMVINHLGRVGVGVASPNSAVHVYGDEGNSISAVMRLRGTNTTAKTTRLQFEDYSGAIADGIIQFSTPNGNSTGAYMGMGYNGTQLNINSNGYVGIGTTTPDSLLHLQNTRGTITGGSSNTGAVIKLHTEAQWESGYGNNQEATTNDYLGSIEFSTGDTSTGEGVRAAVRATVDSYYNSNSLVFETATDASATAPTEKMRIRPDGKTRIGGTDAITSQLTLGDTADPDKITMWSPGAGARSERTKYLSLTVRPMYTANQYYRLNLGASSSGTGATVRYQATFSTGHAAGHGYCEGVATFYAHHSLSKQYATSTSGNPHISYARMYGQGSYYGWSTYPDIRFYLCNATGNGATNGAAIYIQTSGHGNHNSGTYDLYCDIQLDLQVMNSDYNADPLLTAVGASVPGDRGSQIGCTFLS